MRLYIYNPYRGICPRMVTEAWSHGCLNDTNSSSPCPRMRQSTAQKVHVHWSIMLAQIKHHWGSKIIMLTTPLREWMKAYLTKITPSRIVMISWNMIVTQWLGRNSTRESWQNQTIKLTSIIVYHHKIR